MVVMAVMVVPMVHSLDVTFIYVEAHCWSSHMTMPICRTIDYSWGIPERIPDEGLYPVDQVLAMWEAMPTRTSKAADVEELGSARMITESNCRIAIDKSHSSQHRTAWP
jgi:hypothetical protein